MLIKKILKDTTMNIISQWQTTVSQENCWLHLVMAHTLLSRHSGEIINCKLVRMRVVSLGHLASLPCQLSKRPLASLQLGLFSGSDLLETGGAVPVQGHKPVRFQTVDLTSWRLSLCATEGSS